MESCVLTKTEASHGLSGKPNLLTQASKNLLAAIISSSDDAIISKDLNGIISIWNDGARRIFGYEPDEIVGQSILRLIPEELHHEEDFILAKIRAGERVEHFETIRVRKDGERFPVAVTISPVKDDSGTIVGASKIARDISDRRRAEESRLRLAAIVDSADDAIISMDLNGIITSWNEGARRIFGYEGSEIVGQSVLRLVRENLRYEEEEILRKLGAGERIDHYETTRVARDGSTREVSITISPIRNSLGEVVGGSKIARDISSRKKIERMAIQAEKIAATGRMAAAVAHEINNPLASVLNLIYLARQDEASKEEIRNYLHIAEAELERVSHIARQTLGFYRDSGSPSDVYLHELMDSVLSVYKSKLFGHGAVVEARFDDLRKIRVRSGEVVQVFSNIVANAIDAMPDGGKLRISIAPSEQLEKDGLKIIITDTGHGIPREFIGRVFEPFFTTKGDLGNGIGLWIAKQLIERHGGQISISSSTGAGDSGTVVTIFLPFSGTEGGTAGGKRPKSGTEAR